MVGGDKNWHEVTFFVNTVCGFEYWHINTLL